MLKTSAAFAGFSVDDMDRAKSFYTKTLGLELSNEIMGLDLNLPGGGSVYVYQKDDHQPATYTVLNFVVNDIDNAVKTLTDDGIKFEQYDLGGGAKTDEKGVMRGLSSGMGPDIAWFKDPAGNILSVLQAK